jgi:hypothetical protein
MRGPERERSEGHETRTPNPPTKSTCARSGVTTWDRTTVTSARSGTIESKVSKAMADGSRSP